MSELQFADVSLMLDLAILARRLRRKERALWLCGARPHIRMQIQRAGLHRLTGVRMGEEVTALV